MMTVDRLFKRTVGRSFDERRLVLQNVEIEFRSSFVTVSGVYTMDGSMPRLGPSRDGNQATIATAYSRKASSRSVSVTTKIS